jgi:enterochelin esterase-like enzyme
MAALSFSIVSGWFPFVLFWLTVAVCVTTLVLRRGVLMEFAKGVPIGILLTVALFVSLNVWQPIPAGAPQSMYWWLAAACLIAGLVLAGWHTAHWQRRSFGIVAVCLAVLSAGSSVNQTFQYYPTLDRLFGKEANHMLSNSQLNALRAEVRRTGKLPDHGATLAVSIPSSDPRYHPRDAYVWVPPAWFAPKHPQLPVIELLSGSPGDPAAWTRASYVDATSLAFAEQHHGSAPILVMPDPTGTLFGDTECVNSTRFGDVENYLTQDVPRYMQQYFNAQSTPGSMAIGGGSAGGTCALMLSLRHPMEYPTFIDISGYTSPTYLEDNAEQTVQVLFEGSQQAYNEHDPQYLLAHQRFDGLAGWFVVGRQDPPSFEATRVLLPLATRAGIDTCYADPNGGHDYTVQKLGFAYSLPWVSWRLHLTPKPTSVPGRCVPASK